MNKLFIIGLIAFASFNASIAQTQVITKAEMLQHIKKEKLRSPVKVTDAIQAFEAQNSTSKKLRGQELKVTTSNSAGNEEGEAHIAINPKNNQQLIMSYMDNSASGMTFPIYYSNNGGYNWTKSSFNALTYLNQDYGSGTFVAGGGDPIFAYDKNGKLYFSWIFLSFNISVPDTAYANMYWASSVDNGATWALEPGANHFIGKSALDVNTFESYSNSDGFYDRQWFAIDQTSGSNSDNLYCSFVYFPNTIESPALTGITVKTKTGSASTFSSTKHQVYSGESQFGNVAVDNTGKLHVTYCELNQNSIYHKVSSDGGNTFSSAHLIYNGTNLFGSQGNGYIHDRENSATNMVVDGDNNVHVVWSDFPTSPGANYNSYYSRSTDGGNTWSSPITLNFASNKVLMPVVCASGKKVSIGGYAINSSKVSDYYMMTSTDNGATWGTPTKISTQSTDFAASSNSGKWFGDYYNAVRTNSDVYNIWSDGRGTSGSKMYVSITNEYALGLTELTPINGSFELESIYPNPASNQLNLKLNSQISNELSISIIGIDGKQIQHQTQNINSGSNSIVISMASLAQGNYLLQIESKDGYKLARVVSKK